MTSSQDDFGWSTRPVFISSTFNDMHAERDWLWHHVFPRLEQELRRLRLHLEPVDLRIGVQASGAASEEEGELLILKVCLDEIVRCRPFMIVLLGDRFGWVPISERIESAAGRAGMEVDGAGWSVTQLEIEFGILAENSHSRCLFYFREPLPYKKMPPEIAAASSDDFATDAHAKSRADALRELKSRIEDDEDLRMRVHRYSATWDPVAERVTGLEAWGDRVFEDLLRAIVEETRDVRSPTNWREVERAALAEFIGVKRRNFVGRDELVERLTNFARAERGDDDRWGICVTGEAGSGKSALFAQVAERLAGDSSLLLLANASGTGLHSSQLAPMMRRWMEELGETVSEEAASDDVPDELRDSFWAAVDRVAEQRRVVMLLDNVDHIDWLASQTDNFRLIMMAQPKTQPELEDWPRGVTFEDLPQFTREEAVALSDSIWSRYHRTAPARVVEAVLARGDEHRPAFTNPLWLSIAVEQLNVLDADDFAAAQKFDHLPPEQRLKAMMLDVAEAFPATVEELFMQQVERLERQHGKDVVRAFVALMYVSSRGWRASDLQSLLPPAARLIGGLREEPNVAPARIAALLRSFGGHLHFAPDDQSWNYAHGHMLRKSGLLPWIDMDGMRSLARVVLDHLQTLGPNDPVRRREFLYHAMSCGAPDEGAAYLAELESNDGIHLAMVTVMLYLDGVEDCLRTQETEGVEAYMSHVLALIRLNGLDESQCQRLLSFYLVGLTNRLIHQGQNQLLAFVLPQIIRRAQRELERITAAPPLQMLVLIAMEHLSNILTETLSNYEASIQWLTEAEAISRRITEQDDPKLRRIAGPIHAGVLAGIAQAHAMSGRAQEANDTALRSLEGLDRYCELESDISFVRQLEATVLVKIGDALASDEESMRVYRRALTALEFCIEENPEATQYAFQLGTTCQRIGTELIHDRQSLPDAIEILERGMKQFDRLRRVSPSDHAFLTARNQAAIATELATAYMSSDRFGDAVTLMEDVQKSLDYYVAQDNQEPTRLGDLACCLTRLGFALAATGCHERALDELAEAASLTKRLLSQDSRPDRHRPNLRLIQTALERLTTEASDPAIQQRCVQMLAELTGQSAARINRDVSDKTDERQVLRNSIRESLEARRFDEALADVQQAMRLETQFSPSEPELGWSIYELHDSLGAVFLEYGKYPLARNSCAIALRTVAQLARHAPNDADAATRLGMTWQNLSVIFNELNETERSMLCLSMCAQQADRMQSAGIEWSPNLARASAMARMLLGHVEEMFPRLRQATQDLALREICEQVRESAELADLVTPFDEDMYRVRTELPAPTDLPPLELKWNAIPTARRGGLGSRPHPSSNPEEAARLNGDYQRALQHWKALPFWKRWFTPRPERPSGI